MRHSLGESRFLLWQKRVSRLVPAHSKRPPSRDTEKVISVGTVATPTRSRKRMKFATTNSKDCGRERTSIARHGGGGGKCPRLTVGGAVQNDKARVHQRFVLSVSPFHRVRVAAEPARRLVEVHIVMRAIQGPEGSKPGTAAPNNGHLLPPLHRRVTVTRFHGRQGSRLSWPRVFSGAMATHAPDQHRGSGETVRPRMMRTSAAFVLTEPAYLQSAD